MLRRLFRAQGRGLGFGLAAGGRWRVSCLVAEFISPPKVHTFSFVVGNFASCLAEFVIVGNIIPKRCKVYPLSY